MEEALQSGRGAIDWQRQLLAHYCNGEIDIPYAAQNVGNKVTILEALRVPPMSYFIVSGTVDVIEYRSRQPSLRQKPKVMKVVTIAQSHGTQANTPRFGQSKQKFCGLPRLRSASRRPRSVERRLLSQVKPTWLGDYPMSSNGTKRT
jgi:hypothetical protein